MCPRKHQIYSAAVIDIDTSGIHAFEELYRSLQKRDVQVRKYTVEYSRVLTSQDRRQTGLTGTVVLC